jgi:hypothetical protein
VAYISSANASKYELYEDDGNDANAISNKQYEITTFKSSGMKSSLTVNISSNGGKYKGRVENRKMILAIPNVNAMPQSVSINGRNVGLHGLWNASTRILNVPVIFQHTKTEVFIKF